MAETAPSTAPTSLDESLSKFLSGSGTAKLSPNQVTYGTDVPGLGYDPTQQFRPQGDILTINAAPGTGASTAETWAHELDVERQKQDALEFEFQQRQAAQEQALAEQENARQFAQLEMQKAEASRAAAMSPYQLDTAKYGAQTAGYGAQSASYGPATAQAELTTKQLAADAASRQYAYDTNVLNANVAQANKLYSTPGTVYSTPGVLGATLNDWHTVPYTQPSTTYGGQGYGGQTASYGGYYQSPGQPYSMYGTPGAPNPVTYTQPQYSPPVDMYAAMAHTK